MWSMIVAVGIAAAWFEYSYRRNRRKAGRYVQDEATAKNSAVAEPAPAEETENPLKAASSND
jgi:predicted alpha/beta-hydrolase family hydrolase